MTFLRIGERLRLMHGIGATHGLSREHPGYVDGIEGAEAPTILTGHLHSALLLAGSTGLFLAEQSQHFLYLLLRTTAAETGFPRLECADVILGEDFVEELMTGPIGQVLRPQRFCQEAEPPPVIFQRGRFPGHLLQQDAAA